METAERGVGFRSVSEGEGHDFGFAEEKSGERVSGGIKQRGSLKNWRMQTPDTRDRENVPAVSQMGSHILQVVVAHVVDAEDVEVGVLRDAFLDVGI